MERITSRKNEIIRRLRRLGAERDARRESGEFICDGEKLLREALRSGAEVGTVLWSAEAFSEVSAEAPAFKIPGAAQYLVPEELLDYASPLKRAARVLFTARMAPAPPAPPGRTVVLETMQDPGNLGTALRTADAFGIDTVILTGDCADPYHPRSVRATMGAVFRQRFREMEREELRAILTGHGKKLYGAALAPEAEDIRALELSGAAVAIGSEGRGLSAALRALCDGELIIPMRGRSESLNAAVAAAVVMWEMVR